jgi:hypothetical protein
VGYSEDFSAGWNIQNASITSNSIVAPNGTTTADSLIASNGVNGASGVYVPETTIGVKTISCYVKKGSKRWASIIGYNGNSNCWYDLDNGVVGTRGANYSTSSITSVGNGWYRIDAVMAVAIGSDVNIGVYATDNDNALTCTGDGTTVSSYIWGAQINIGSTAKPYFPTTDRLNVPRLTYQNGGGGCPSLLLEPQRTNLVLQSQDFDNASWSKSNSSVTANSTTSPDGTTNADSLIENTANSLHLVSQVNFSAGTYTTSVYVKANTRNWVYLTIYDGVADRGAFFNVSTGVVGNIDTGVTASIQSVGNGWYRCIVTATPVATFSSSIQLATANGTRTYLGNGTSGLFIWGFQLEAGAYPTTYIPTTSATATRVADLGSNDVFGSTYTLDADFCLFQDFECFDFVNNVYWSGGNYATGGDYRSYMITYNTGNITLFGVNEVTAAQLTTFTFSTNTRYKVAVRRVGSTINWFINGTKYSNTTGTTTTTVKIRSISGASLGGKNTMKLNEAIIFEDETLTDADCIALTTI